MTIVGKGRTVVDMNRDWNSVFPFEKWIVVTLDKYTSLRIITA